MVFLRGIPRNTADRTYKPESWRPDFPIRFLPQARDPIILFPFNLHSSLTSSGSFLFLPAAPTVTMAATGPTIQKVPQGCSKLLPLEALTTPQTPRPSNGSSPNVRTAPQAPPNPDFPRAIPPRRLVYSPRGLLPSAALPSTKCPGDFPPWQGGVHGHSNAPMGPLGKDGPEPLLLPAGGLKPGRCPRLRPRRGWA